MEQPLVPKTILLPKPAPIDLATVNWILVKTEEGEFLALTPAEFELLQLNNVEILRYVKEVNAQIAYYRAEARR